MYQDSLTQKVSASQSERRGTVAPKRWGTAQNGACITRASFSAQVRNLAERLPEATYAINLCRDRYKFMVAFTAVALRGQTNLLPPNRAPKTLENLAYSYADSYSLVDTVDETGLSIPSFAVNPSETLAWNISKSEKITIPPTHKAAILFTSGSQGRPKPIVKRWWEFQWGTVLTAQRFGLGSGAGYHLVATVPPQHMFGLETSILLPVLSEVGFYCGCPFFPEDVRRALLAIPERRILVTTPIHLRTLVRSGIQWPQCEFLLLATASLSRDLAQQAEALFHAPVKEIYGSTETGAIASRRTVQSEYWQFYDGIEHRCRDGHCVIDGAHIPKPFKLHDQVVTGEDNRYKLLGRNEDLVKIGGKRASLADLNHKLLQIPGVKDGVFIDSLNGKSDSQRLAALVVAPGLERKHLLASLAEWLDPVFLPRPLRFVDHLPRNETGKLPRKELLSLLELRD